MSSAESSVAVVYLAWLPYGTGHMINFAKTYQLFEPGFRHELYIAFNGQAKSNPESTEAYLRILKENGIRISGCFYFDEGQDIDVYRSVAGSIVADLVLFLNTYSELLARDWLKFYVQAFEPGIGVVGATASNQSYYSSVFEKLPIHWEAGKNVAYHFRKYKLFVKAFFYWRFLFRPFPNPHVRTNAFMVRRLEFLEIPPSFVKTKFRAYQFESGRNGMTNWYKRRGLKAVIIDRRGVCYDSAKWSEAEIFWTGHERNLLVSDNQTALYANAGDREKKQMSRLAWGIK